MKVAALAGSQTLELRDTEKSLKVFCPHLLSCLYVDGFSANRSRF